MQPTPQHTSARLPEPEVTDSDFGTFCAATQPLTDHERIAALFEQLLQAMHEAEHWVDEVGIRAVHAVERAQVLWENTYAYQPDGDRQ